MNKNILYIGIAVIIGLLAGYVLFGTGSGTTNQKISDSHDHSAEAENQMWTCSMHPQIMQPEPGNCPICGMDLIPTETGGEGLGINELKMTENAMALANIQTTVVGAMAGDTENTTSLSGKITVNEEANAVQASYFDGRIERLNVNYEGQEVVTGELLATIYSPELVAAQQELLTTASLKETQPQLYMAVRNKLKLWKLSEGQISTIENSGKVTENFPVYATVSGTVSEVMSAEGDYVKKGQPIVKVSNLNTVWAELDAYESQLSQFKPGQKISIGTNAYPNKTFDAKISFIDPILDNSTRTVTIRATLNNSNNLFKPGMFITGKIASKNVTEEEQLFVPSSAVMWTGERSLVYVKVKTDAPVFEMREVMLGSRRGEQIEVTSGLAMGEEIVTNGTFTVDAAAQLQGKKSMMNKSGGKTMTGHEGHLGMEETASIENDSHSNLNNRLNVSMDFQNQLKAVFNNYIKLKDALVKDDVMNVSAEAKTILNNLAKVDMKLVTEEMAHSNWMQLQKEIKTSALSISTSSDIKEQRNHFKHLSEQLTKAIRLFGINEKVYNQFCPMADNNNGAYWLSREEKVLNPYFGKAMLTCGEVKQVIE